MDHKGSGIGGLIGAVFARLRPDAGVGAGNDWAAAVKWYELTAVQGDSLVMGNLGSIYHCGGERVPRGSNCRCFLVP